MNLEMAMSIVSCAVVFVAVLLRLNAMRAADVQPMWWGFVQVSGLALILTGCVGVVAEWFLPRAEFHAETVLVVGLALFAFAISRGQFHQVVAHLQGWDGQDRRRRPLRAEEFEARTRGG